MMTRSPKTNLITPPKLMPPFQSTTAIGTLPTEQTKDSAAMTGPMIGPQTAPRAGWLVRTRACQKLFGTQAARAPEMRKPISMSCQRLARSM